MHAVITAQGSPMYSPKLEDSDTNHNEWTSYQDNGFPRPNTPMEWCANDIPTQLDLRILQTNSTLPNIHLEPTENNPGCNENSAKDLANYDTILEMNRHDINKGRMPEPEMASHLKRICQNSQSLVLQTTESQIWPRRSCSSKDRSDSRGKVDAQRGPMMLKEAATAAIKQQEEERRRSEAELLQLLRLRPQQALCDEDLSLE